jgi:hypothetical protein
MRRRAVGAPSHRPSAQIAIIQIRAVRIIPSSCFFADRASHSKGYMCFISWRVAKRALCASRSNRVQAGLQVFLLAWFLVFAGLAKAQQAAPAAVWQGVLHDTAGAPIAQAKVRLASKGARAEAVTGADGRFQLKALEPGQ